MLFGSLFVFTMVALMGLSIVGDTWKRRSVGAVLPRLHAAAALFGSALVIGAVPDGDTRLYNNIGMAVVTIHAGLAVACYLLLGFYALNK